MAIPHAESGEVVDIRPLGGKIASSVTTTLVKTDRLEVIRLVVPAGKEIAPHKVDGEITVQCLEGRIAFSSGGQMREIPAGHFCYLAGGVEHSVTGIEDSTVLVTILL